MSRWRRSASNALAASSFGLLAMLLGSSAGCEFISRVDRSDIAQNGGNGGGGGSGGGPECATAADCPGTDTVCRSRSCVDGVCGFVDAPAGTATGANTAGDCLREICDGQGTVTTAPDDADILDDQKECTTDICANGTPQNNPKGEGATCTSDGGKVCNGGDACVECVTASDCTSLVCTANQCVPPACADTVKNGAETDVDCGGADCAGCADGKLCTVAADCESKICAQGVCQIPTCTDTIENGTETDVDCGGSCAPCAPGLGCSQDSDCVGGMCSGSVCLETCTDGLKNANETDVDCGGPTCSPCADSEVCSVGTDCVSNVCMSSVCVASTCSDMVKNGNETGVDCGGGTCAVCGDGQGCTVASDCATGVCMGMVCQAATCTDTVKNGAETDVDCGGGTCPGCVLGAVCGQNSDCSSNICAGAVCVDALCGDSLVTGAETCDDGNAQSNDGCSSMCAPESGYTCNMAAPTVCTPNCNDSVVVPGEGCDDGNATDGDGCSATCSVEVGYSCMGSPSACSSLCGDGIAILTETCDDGNMFGGDGCSTSCTLEMGFNCTGTPSVCTAICGDGKLVGFEECDDGNTNAGDGCNSSCYVESSYACAGVPSVCSLIEIEPNGTCGTASGPFTPPFVMSGRILPVGDQDFIQVNIPAYADLMIDTFSPTVGQCPTVDNEVALLNSACVQLALDDQDGLNSCAMINSTLDPAAKSMAPGTYYIRVNDWLNNGAIDAYKLVVTYVALCGNGIREGSETCDDGNLNAGDGCAVNCKVEQGYVCAPGTPNVCTFNCGNGIIDGTDTCDDGNAMGGDGCSALCAVEPSYICTGTPSVCIFTCGNGIVDATDLCDDGNLNMGDGCSPQCLPELGYNCTGSPSTCAKFENWCSDNMDNDADGLIDSADSDCQIPSYFPACAMGESLQVFKSIDIPKAIPDSPNTVGVTSNLVVGAGAGTINRAAMLYNINHTWDEDLDLTLITPTGANLDVCSDNGGSADNFTNIVLDSTCTTSVTSGAAPFSGCYSPETSFASFVGTQASGVWKFKAVDDVGSDTGTINSWAMIFCTTP